MAVKVEVGFSGGFSVEAVDLIGGYIHSYSLLGCSFGCSSVDLIGGIIFGGRRWI